MFIECIFLSGITMSATDNVTDRERSEDTIQGTWRLLLAVGIVIAILGLLAVFTPLFAGLTLSFFLGAYLVIGGIVHFVHAFSGREWTGFLIQLVLAVVFVVAGLSLLLNPFVGLVTLTVLLIAFFFVDGIVETVMGFRLRPQRGWLSIVVSGVLSLVIAALVWLAFPSSALWALGLLFGIGLLTSGISLATTAMGGRAEAQQSVTSSATEAR